MDSLPLSACSALSEVQKKALQKGKIITLADLLLTTPNTIAKQCQLSISDVKSVLVSVCTERRRRIRKLDDIKHEGNEMFTTGDTRLDDALEGGIRTGMIWEIVGESAAGKTQLALQMALTVQIPQTLGGLSGSACYLVTSSTLPTIRLVQMSEAHPLLSPSVCNLSNIHTIATPTIPILIRVLSETLPAFLKARSTNSSPPMVKLLVIDALAELFHSSNKTTTHTLVERSRNLSEISTLLHTLASTYRIAVLVLNEVSDAFDRRSAADANNNGDVMYHDQVRWFSRAHNIPGEDRKEACLGLVWANQVNARILLSRTGRRRYQEEVDSLTNKHRKAGNHTCTDSSSSGALGLFAPEEQATLIRRLSVIFTPFGRPRSLDYVVTTGGIATLSNEYTPLGQQRPLQEPAVLEKSNQRAPEALHVSPLDVGSSQAGSEEVDDEWEQYWRHNDIPDELYNDIDLDALATSTKSLSETNT